MESKKYVTTQEMYQQICSQLKSDKQYIPTMEQLTRCTSDQERIHFVSNLPAVKEKIFSSTQLELVNKKNNTVSISLRKEGNNFFQKKNYSKALELYTRSALSAEIGRQVYFQDFIKDVQNEECMERDVTLATAYANRSAANFHLCHYKACLLDISLAFKCGYPKENEHKLYERQGKCNVQLKRKQEAIASFQNAVMAVNWIADEKKRKKTINSLEQEKQRCYEMFDCNDEGNISLESINRFHSDPPSIEMADRGEIFLSSVQAVGIRESKEMGRGLITTRNVDVGEVLIIERPYSSVVLRDMEKTHCDYCCSRVVCPLPCCHCSYVQYCSFKCQKASWDMYHHVECSILYAVQNADIKLGHLSLRMVIQAGFQVLKKKKSEFQTLEMEDAVGYNAEGKYESGDYRAVYSLVKHTEFRTPEDLFNRAVRATFLLRCLEQTKYFDDQATQEDKMYIGGHILRHLQMLPCNAHEVSELKWKPGVVTESETLEVGSGIYATLSLINHSCDPSVVRHSYGNLCVLRAIKQIKKGEEILDNYGVLYPLSVRGERRAKLASQYYFDCNCEACQLDLPTYFDIPCDQPVFKCEKCEGPIFMSASSTSQAKYRCSACRFEQDLKPKLNELQNLEEAYKKSIAQVLNGDPSVESLKSMLEFLSACCSFVCLPWREFNNCQEGIKQCYAVQANNFIVS